MVEESPKPELFTIKCKKYHNNIPAEWVVSVSLIGDTTHLFFEKPDDVKSFLFAMAKQSFGLAAEISDKIDRETETLKCLPPS